MATPSPETSQTPTTLGYAPAPRSKWRRRVRNVLFVCALPVAVIVLLRWGYVPLRNKAVFLDRQSRCMNFAVPPGTVAYTEDAATLARLTGGAASGPGWATLTSNGAAIAFYLAPPPLRNIEQTPGVDIPQGFGPVFLHRRSAVGGTDRLVVVKVDSMRAYRAPGMGSHTIADHLFEARVMRPATLRAVPSVTRTPWNPAAPAPAFGELTILAGQPDPGDASHFTIDYLTAAGRGTIDGWLQPDDTLKLLARDGPLAQQGLPASPYNPPR